MHNLEEQADQPRVYVATFGCQMNEYDSDRVLRLLADRGYSVTCHPEQADLIFLNTCSIREKAEQKVYSLLGRLRPIKEARPEVILGVGGCVAQQLGDEFLKRAPYLDLVVGTHAIPRLPELVDEVKETGRPICRTEFNYQLTPAPGLEEASDSIKAFLTIMQGCDNFCSYCVVPYVRGREISRQPEEILAEARNLLDHGIKELTLLGQNVNSYGRGLTPPVDFAGLLEKTARLTGLERLRFTTSHPKDLSDDLIRTLADLEPVCEHIHLPVQSGSSRILKAMRRGYTREEYLERIQALREVCPDMAITTDVIVGFPGEKDDDFEQTIHLVREVRFDGMYSFKYSDRPMTRALSLGDKVEEAVKGRRLTRLQSLQKQITTELNQALVGKRVEVLVEGRGSRYPGQLTGRTRSNKIVNFEGPAELIGCLVFPLIVEAWANSVRGVLETDQKQDDSGGNSQNM